MVVGFLVRRLADLHARLWLRLWLADRLLARPTYHTPASAFVLPLTLSLLLQSGCAVDMQVCKGASA